MAWVTPPTFVSGNALTAAQLNILSGDLNETGPAKATAASRLLVTNAANQIVEREIKSIDINTQEGTTSVTFADLATVGPQVTLTVGTRALIWVMSTIQHGTVNGISYAAAGCTGATTVTPQDARGIRYQASAAGAQVRCGAATMFTGMTPGSTTFTIQYRASTGTATFAERVIIVLGL